MNWHGSCYACTCTTRDHSQSEFALPFLRGVAAKAAHVAPSLPACAATFNHDQMYDDRRAGQLVGERSRHAPVRVTLFRGQGLPETGRGYGLGIFSAEGRGANPRLANNHPLRECVRECVAKGSKRHSSAPSSVSYQHGTEGVGSAQEIIGVYQNDDC